jgi:hypothetical protein
MPWRTTKALLVNQPENFSARLQEAIANRDPAAETGTADLNNFSSDSSSDEGGSNPSNSPSDGSDAEVSDLENESFSSDGPGRHIAEDSDSTLDEEDFDPANSPFESRVSVARVPADGDPDAGAGAVDSANLQLRPLRCLANRSARPLRLPVLETPMYRNPDAGPGALDPAPLPAARRQAFPSIQTLLSEMNI